MSSRLKTKLGSGEKACSAAPYIGGYRGTKRWDRLRGWGYLSVWASLCGSPLSSRPTLARLSRFSLLSGSVFVYMSLPLSFPSLSVSGCLCLSLSLSVCLSLSLIYIYIYPSLAIVPDQGTNPVMRVIPLY